MGAIARLLVFMVCLSVSRSKHCNIDTVLDHSSLVMAETTVIYLADTGQEECNEACCNSEDCFATVFDSSNGDCLLSDCTASTCEVVEDENNTVTYVSDMAMANTYTPTPHPSSGSTNMLTASTTTVPPTNKVDITNTDAVTNSLKVPENNKETVTVGDYSAGDVSASNITTAPMAVPPGTPTLLTTEKSTPMPNKSTEGINETNSTSTDFRNISQSTPPKSETSSLSTNSALDKVSETLGLKLNITKSNYSDSENGTTASLYDTIVSNLNYKNTTTANEITGNAVIDSPDDTNSTATPSTLTYTSIMANTEMVAGNTTIGSLMSKNTKSVFTTNTTTTDSLTPTLSVEIPSSSLTAGSDVNANSTSATSISSTKPKAPPATTPLHSVSTSDSKASSNLPFLPPYIISSSQRPVITDTISQNSTTPVYSSITSPLFSLLSSTSSPSNLSFNSDEATTSNYNASTAGNRWTGRLHSPDQLSTGVIVILSFGIFFTAVVMAIIGKRLFDGWQRRHYNRMDYLINGIYN